MRFRFSLNSSRDFSRRLIRAGALTTLCLMLLAGCQNGSLVDPFDTIPPWLQARIDSISANPEYYGTKVYRYTWHGVFFYYFMIPLSSCAYCDIYDWNGKRLHFGTDDEVIRFITEKSDGVLIWEWEAHW